MVEYKNEFILIPKKISDKTIGEVRCISHYDDKIMVIVNDTIIDINLDKKAFNIDEVGSN